jgi:predicted CXXCH cytochrome family protein
MSPAEPRQVEYTCSRVTAACRAGAPRVLVAANDGAPPWNERTPSLRKRSDVSAYRIAWIVTFLGAGLLGAGASMAAGTPEGAHLGDADCTICHLQGSEFARGTPPKLVAAQESLCAGCHQRALELSHPSGFVPTRALPADYPLDWKGELTCSTCHLTHGRKPGLLRGKRHARDFCLACHDQGFFSGMKDAGSSLVLSGHIDAVRGRGGVDIDRHSLHCLGCHAGGHTAGGTVSVSHAGVMHRSGATAPHPIGVSYRDASRKGGLRSEYELAQKHIVMSDGRISCVSCHEAYNKDHGKLVVPMARSALCLACHTK